MYIHVKLYNSVDEQRSTMCYDNCYRPLQICKFEHSGCLHIFYTTFKCYFERVLLTKISAGNWLVHGLVYVLRNVSMIVSLCVPS